MCSLRGTGRSFGRWAVVGVALAVFAAPQVATARPKIRQAFFAVFPNAVGTQLDSVPSHSGHCGVCHYDFNGGGTRNPWGARIEAVIGNYPNTDAGREDAIRSVENEDPDADGFTTLVEVTDVTHYTNTPTFPGLTPGNVGNVTNVDLADIQFYLVPSSGGDTTPPVVTVIAPNGGETLTAETSTTVEWTATDASGVSGINLYASYDGGLSYNPVALGISNTGSYSWFPANRPTTSALFLVEAVDNAFNYGDDLSDDFFVIESPPGGTVPTTLRDFDMPGSQPFDAGILNPPEACAVCHGNYDSAVEPYFNWKGSMMAQASIDPLFEAALTIANQDAPDSGDLCLRCHISRGWLQGRSIPTDGSRMLTSDKIGVSCDLCHRLVDPIADPANPTEDTQILADLAQVPLVFASGMYVVDPTGARRGPFANADSGHPVLVSPFHREAALCGTCHNVSNPAFQKDANGNYVPNGFDAPASNFAANVIGPVERTYSEWLHSDYNTPEGVYAPQFGGNKDYVASCQDCHMRDVTGQGCNLSPPVRTDLPLHDMTGGSAWLPGLLSTLYPNQVDDAAMQAGITRARYMLQHAATLDVTQDGPDLKVTVTNETGHKLPTGYPEGRRIWINVKFYDVDTNLIAESGAYDPSTGVLTHDAEAKIYEILPATSGIPNVPDGTEFHFALNNAVIKDNRIPPRGFDNAVFADFGGAHVAYSYADGQYWDETTYTIPAAAASAEVTLYYQSTSKEFVEFLRDENFTNTKGQEFYDLWNNNGKCPPELMATSTLALQTCTIDAECDDGLYCNGLETCAAGFCAPGGDPCPGQGCDEVTDSCYPLDCNNDGICGVAEDCNTCPNDCFTGPGGTCGDGICAGSGEDCFTCPTDCRCTGGNCSNGCCGDGICAGENTSSCPVDCDPAFAPPTPTCCGDGTCEGTENDVNCAVDCAGCTVNADCDDGVFCNGAETCNASGQCEPGTPVDCSDGVNCTVDACNEATDSCDHTPNDAFCDNGLYCDGTETCDTQLGCQAGTPVDCNDGVDCTVDSCNETTDSCDNTPDHGFCDNGLYCDGAETCDAQLGCQAGTPVDCNDGVDCTVDACNETTDSCDHTPDNAFCDNGLYCDGAETCDAQLGCQAGTPVDCNDGVNCTVDSCNETTDSCDHTPDDGFCDNGLYCDGTETCDAQLGCRAGTPVDCNDGVNCTVDSCNETTDSCDHTPDDGFCDNGLYCDGAERCDVLLGCQLGTPVDCNDGVNCTVDSCNETTDSCDNTPNDGFCDNGLYCDGAETCDAVLGCQSGSDPCPTITCDEVNDRCVNCLIDEDCNDGLYCNGTETCDTGTGVCQPGTSVTCDDSVDCTVDSCNETTDACDFVPNDGFCDNGLYCDGAETCDVLLGCRPGTPVDCNDGVDCTIDACNETTDSCDNAPDDGFCDNGLYCDGTETCDAQLGCQNGTPVDCNDNVDCTIDSCNEDTDSCDHVPDGCGPVCSDLPAPGVADTIAKSRYITFHPGAQDEPSAIRVTLVDVHEFGIANGEVRWLGPPQAYPEEDSSNPGQTFIASRLTCEPYYRDWSTINTLHVYGGDIVPGSTYRLQTLSASCDEGTLGEDAFGAGLQLVTGVWGDVTEPYAASGSTQPDFSDISAVVEKYLAVPTAPIKAQAQLQPNTALPSRPIDFRDVAADVQAFVGTSYTASIGATGPCTCPSSVICGATACTSEMQCGTGYCIDGFCTDACGRCSSSGQTLSRTTDRTLPVRRAAEAHGTRVDGAIQVALPTAHSSLTDSE